MSNTAPTKIYGPEPPEPSLELSDRDRIKQLGEDVAYLSAELASLRTLSVPTANKLAPEAIEATESTARTTCSKCERSFTSRNKMMKHVYGNNCGRKGNGKDGLGLMELTGGKTKN